MQLIIVLFIISITLQLATSQVHMGIKIAEGLRNGVSAGTKAGLEEALEGANHLVSETAGNLIGGAEGIIGGAGKKIIGVFHRKRKLGDEVLDNIEKSINGSNSSSDKRKNNDGKNNWSGHKKNGRGTHGKSGIGSRGGILTPIEDLLGLTHVVCSISNSGEGFIEKFGKFHLDLQDRIKQVDHDVANFITQKIILKGVDVIRRGYVGCFDFFVKTHIALDRLVTNSAVEIYRVLKSPLMELLACH